ncbi:MAG: hypothetical protein LBP59_10030 [Planctomycetaceae bacterium]|jgi:Spy/CpxP family protein refolding chaperone|nr:hypothetical protein [Planctomycetaceae bacterium]
MTKTIITISAIFFVALIFAGGVFANKPSEAERFETFIKTEGLIKALELTESQIERLKIAVNNSYFPHGRNGKPGIEPPPEEGFKLDDDFRTEIYKILTPKQKELYLTYKFQLDGGFNANALYVTKLEIFNLTTEQQKKLQKIEIERSKKYQELIKIPKQNNKNNDKNTSENYRNQMKEIAKIYNKKMIDILTEKQLELGKKLTEESKNLRKKVGLKEGH